MFLKVAALIYLAIGFKTSLAKKTLAFTRFMNGGVHKARGLDARRLCFVHLVNVKYTGCA